MACRLCGEAIRGRSYYRVGRQVEHADCRTLRAGWAWCVAITGMFEAIRDAHADDPWDNAPYVCSGCHAVGPESCAPGCIDAEIAESNLHYDDFGPCD